MTHRKLATLAVTAAVFATSVAPASSHDLRQEMARYVCSDLTTWTRAVGYPAPGMATHAEWLHGSTWRVGGARWTATVTVYHGRPDRRYHFVLVQSYSGTLR